MIKYYIGSGNKTKGIAKMDVEEYLTGFLQQKMARQFSMKITDHHLIVKWHKLVVNC